MPAETKPESRLTNPHLHVPRPVIPAKAGIHMRQPRLPLETKPESRPTNPLSLFHPRHSRESGNPEEGDQTSHLKPIPNRNQQIPSPFMGEG